MVDQESAQILGRAVELGDLSLRWSPNLRMFSPWLRLLSNQVEVKGTTGQGLSVILTHGEVNHVRSNGEQSALVIVSGIVLEEGNGEWRACGGIVTTHNDPWTLIEKNLSATQYRYEVK